MNVAVGCDHAGFPLKGELLRLVTDLGHTFVDCGGTQGVPDQTPSDYPDVAKAVASAILSGRADRGIVVCGSGVGVAIAANKLHGIRAGVCHDTYSAHQAVEHDDMNILCLGARVIGPSLAAELVKAFLAAEFTGEERHVRRLAKIKDLENT